MSRVGKKRIQAKRSQAKRSQAKRIQAKRDHPGKWSMYPELHTAVSNLLDEDYLSFNFYDRDDAKYTRAYDTAIVGHFTCEKENCNGDWFSNSTAITIRKYPNKRYNARVYHQACASCGTLGKPKVEESYPARVAYRLKKWSGVQVERPPISPVQEFKHRHNLCEWCKLGRCGTKKQSL